MIMEHCIYTLPFEPFTISCPNGVPAHFSCAGTADGFEVRVQHLCSGVFGLGERYDAANYLGKTAVSAVEEKFCRQGDKTYCPMPFFWTDTGLGVYAETARVTRFEFAPEDIMLHLPAACALHVFAGTPEEIVAGYMRLSGQAVLPPKWALGPWISANHWDSREKLENAVAEAQERGFPVTVAVVEAWSDEATFYIFRGAKYEPRPAGAALRLDDFDFSASPWPQPGEMIENLHGRGVHLVLWQIPVYKQLEPHEPANRQLELDWADAVERGLCVTAEGGTPYKIPQGHWFAGSLVPDFTNPQTVESWFGKRVYLNELGVDGFKTDGGEFILSAGARFADGTAGDEGRNLYPQMYTGAYTENLAPGQALFSRAGYVGAHTTPMLWAGDQLSSFDELRSVLNAGLSASASGVVFWGFDIGGFAGELPTPELYMRATQLACFVPVMQWHSEPDGGQFRLLQPGMEGNNERSPWNIERAFGLSGYADSLRHWHCLRMELLPYIYAEALKCTRGSRPLMRMLPYAWPGDRRAVSCSDEYMFGGALLVAPVLSAGEGSRRVYLPAGEWYDFFTGERLEGGTDVVRESAGGIPVFVRSGQAVPLNLSGEGTLGRLSSNRVDAYENLTFRLYGPRGEYRFEDDLGSSLTLAWDGDKVSASGSCAAPYSTVRIGG